MTPRAERSCRRPLLVAGGVGLGVVLAAAGNLLSISLPGPRTQHWAGHLSFAVGMTVLLGTAWRARPAWPGRRAGVISWLPAIGLAVLLAGQLIEAMGAFGWAEFDGYLVVDDRLAQLHQIGILLFPPGLLLLVAGLGLGAARHFWNGKPGPGQARPETPESGEGSWR